MSEHKLASPKLEVCGFFKLEAVNEETGERRLLADWFPNLILDQGLNRLGTGSVLGFTEVGAGSTPPTVSDTGLVTRIASTSTTQSSSDSYVAGPPDYCRHTRTQRFAAGAAAGNLSEVGVGWSATAGNLFSRALIKDGAGNPTTITVLASEALDVTYELRMYPPTSDVAGSITISGTSYNYVIRPADVSSSVSWSALTTPPTLRGIGGYGAPLVYSGAIGARTGYPSGNTGSTTEVTVSTSAYSNNSYALGGTVTYGLNGGNVAGGIKTALVGPGYTYWQIEFTPAIAKTNTKVLTLSYSITWARRP